MDTEIIKIDEQNIDMSLIKKAGQIIKTGGLVAFPTETVYGLGGDALNPKSSKRIYTAKGRPSDNPLIVHISKWESLKEIVEDIPFSAKALADKFWPGPLTMIMKKSSKVPMETTGGLDTVAVRMPVNKIALALIEAAGGYVAAPSANLSGRPSPTSVKYVIEDMANRIDVIIDGGDANIGLESTIVDLTENPPLILRPGYITESQLETVLNGVKVDRGILGEDSNIKPKAPGMKYRHYAPKGSLTIVSGSSENVIDYIISHTEEHVKQGQKVGIIGTDENLKRYSADSIKSVGSVKDEEKIAHRLYNILREFDDENVDIIFSESFEEGELGTAIMNRLLKAAGYQIVQLD